MPVGILSLHLLLPGCSSLKEKRSRIKPLLSRLHREFNISTAEMDLQDTWGASIVGCAIINSDTAHIQRSLQTVVKWLENSWHDVEVVDDSIEII